MFDETIDGMMLSQLQRIRSCLPLQSRWAKQIFIVAFSFWLSSRYFHAIWDAESTVITFSERIQTEINMLLPQGVSYLSQKRHESNEDLFPSERLTMEQRNTTQPDSSPKDGPSGSTNDEHGCYSRNSEAWINGPRFGNIDEGMTSDFVKQMILDIPTMLTGDMVHARRLLDRSMCMRESRFVSVDTETSFDVDDPKLVRMWATRLCYLAIHYHQHRLAIPEASMRYAEDSTCSQDTLSRNHNVGLFDYECPNAKYVVYNFAGIGIGANIRGGAAVGIMTALLSDRIFLFISKGPTGIEEFNSPWALASCEREDHQCVFQPTTPCTLTHDDLRNAWIMPKPDSRAFLRKNGRLPDEHQDDKVIKCMLMYEPDKVPIKAREKLTKLSHELIDALPVDDPRVPLLRKAAESILDEDPLRFQYHYGAATQKASHAASFYSMRPNPQSRERIDEILSQIIPKDVDLESTIGLPIRASDKCYRESECLSFDDHMRVSSDLWGKYLNISRGEKVATEPTIIFTTESRSVIKDHAKFMNNSDLKAALPFNFRFVMNTEDVLPNTGKLSRGGRSHTADEAMLSAMSSLQVQMAARFSVGNCCSNFHALLSDYLMEGCGAARENTFLCLQEHSNPYYRLCCGWHHECKNKKAAEIAAIEAAKNFSQSTTL